MKGKLVKIKDFKIQNLDLSGKEGLIVKGPYEYSVKFNKKYTKIFLVCDVLIDGKIYAQIPRKNIV